jgi:dUTP pyrophosphatase
LGEKDVIMKDGERIAQLVVAPVWRSKIVEADTLESTKRGGAGFGSTGV